jgi:16S rRNA (cytidine1402-2'-O)-methyltransferase
MEDEQITSGLKTYQMGTLFLIPTTLGGEGFPAVIPQAVQEIAIGLRHFAVEEVKTARRYLRKLDRTFPIDDSEFFEVKKNTPAYELTQIIKVLQEGHDVGIISEAGCPGIADPGADLVAMAHKNNIHVKPLTGPSSILLALIGSGMNGQSFIFHGYLPKDKKDRVRKLKDMEMETRKSKQTQIFMDTPFRSNHVMDDMVNELLEDTLVCVASQLTLEDEDIRTMTVKKWKEKAYDLSKRPAIFIIGKV